MLNKLRQWLFGKGKTEAEVPIKGGLSKTYVNSSGSDWSSNKSKVEDRDDFYNPLNPLNPVGIINPVSPFSVFREDTSNEVTYSCSRTWRDDDDSSSSWSNSCSSDFSSSSSDSYSSSYD